MAHILFSPDGNRRFTAQSGQKLVPAYHAAGEHLADVTVALLECNLLNEVTIYAVAAYNLSRVPEEVEAIAAGAMSFFSKLHTDLDENIEITHLGYMELIRQMSLPAANLLENLLIRSPKIPTKRLNILFAYDSLHSCPDGIDPREWKPFKYPLDLIVRPAQPSGLIRDSGIFPMSEQAYRHGMTELFPHLRADVLVRRVEDLLKQIGRD